MDSMFESEQSKALDDDDSQIILGKKQGKLQFSMPRKRELIHRYYKTPKVQREDHLVISGKESAYLELDDKFRMVRYNLLEEDSNQHRETREETFSQKKLKRGIRRVKSQNNMVKLSKSSRYN